MKFSTKEPRSGQITSHMIGLGFTSEGLFSSLGQEIDRRLGGLLSKTIKKEELKGFLGESRLFPTHGKIPSENILLIGLGDTVKNLSEKDAGTLLEIFRKSAARLLKSGNKSHAASIALEDFDGFSKKVSAEQRGQAIAEGVVLANYNFDRYKKPTNGKTVKEVVILSKEGASAFRGAKRGVAFAEATNLARDLINTPANDMTPKHMADEAKKLSRLPGLTVQVMDKKQIEKLGMGCYLAVAQGSVEPPYFIHVHYRPTGKPKKRIALIGKGVNFDSGGLSLKTAPSMETMKDDMSGSASMLGIMKALSELKPPIEVHGFAAMTENMPSATAVKPGDIARAMNGKTVEILNTDAEGRLTLADAMGYAQKFNPDQIIDFATLTGACVVALGELCSGIMGNNQELIDRIIQNGKMAGEKIWQLPLVEEYREELKSSVADLKNVGGRFAGTITAGLFLQEFINSKIPWAHIDIAGPSWTEKEQDYCPRGGTGHLVRTLLHYLLQQ